MKYNIFLKTYNPQTLIFNYHATFPPKRMQGSVKGGYMKQGINVDFHCTYWDNWYKNISVLHFIGQKV